MSIVIIAMTVAFSTILCFAEIPKMLKEKLYRELWTFSVLLLLGTSLEILKTLEVQLPNPSDLVVWVFSPISDVLKDILK